MMVKMLLSIIIAMKTMLLLKNVSLRWILFLCSSSTSRNITTKWSAIMVFMPDTGTMTKSSGVPFRKTDSPSFAVLQNGVITSLCLLDMILFAALTARLVWLWLIFISITNGFLWKKCTKGPWPNLNAVPLDFSSRLLHTVFINRREAS